MNKFLLDTNICIYMIKNRPESVKKKFETFSIGEVCISSVTVSELVYGAYKSQKIEQNLKTLEKFFLPLDIVDFDYKASFEYGKIRADLEKRGRVIGQLDMQIAGVALANDMTVMTNNIKEFERVAGLKVENWV